MLTVAHIIYVTSLFSPPLSDHSNGIYYEHCQDRGKSQKKRRRAISDLEYGFYNAQGSKSRYMLPNERMSKSRYHAQGRAASHSPTSPARFALCCSRQQESSHARTCAAHTARRCTNFQQRRRLPSPQTRPKSKGNTWVGGHLAPHIDINSTGSGKLSYENTFWEVMTCGYGIW